jgi:hypothetical protein
MVAVGDVVLYVIAALALVWALVPAVAFALGGARVRKELRRDPARAEPRADDPDHARRYQQFWELGFRPVGVTRETCWFMNATRWYWHSLEWSYWMQRPDDGMLVSFHRLLPDEPVRFGVVTLFDDGGLVRTTCPGVRSGMRQDAENSLRFELKNVEPAELVAKHEVHVAAFASASNRKVRPATFEEVTAAETVKDRGILSGRSGSYQLLLRYFVLPALVGGWLLSALGGSFWRRVALGVCAGAAMFALERFVQMPKRRRERVLRSHSKDASRERDMQARFEAAKQLLQEQRYSEATEEFVWLWNNIERVEPGMGGVRVSFMAGKIETLVALHGPARQPFEELRNTAGAAADADHGAGRQRLDWIVLNGVLGDEDRTIAWFDQVKADPGAAGAIASVSRFLLQPLRRRGRWADIGRLYAEPLKELAFQHHAFEMGTGPGLLKRLGEERFAQVREISAKHFRTAAAELVASLRAAGRTADADAVRQEALRLDPSSEMKAALDSQRAPPDRPN